MRTIITQSIIGVSAMALAATATPAMAKDHHGKDKVGNGAFLTYVYEPSKLAALYPERKPIDFKQVNTRDIDALNIVGDSCVEQTKLQTPSWLKVVGVTALRNAPGAFVGGYLGSMAGGLVPKGSVVTAVGYGKYNTVATVGGSIGAGINNYEMGKHTAVAGCVAGILPKAQADKYINRDIVVVYNTWTVYAKTRKRSEFPAPTAQELAGDSSTTSGDTSQDGTTQSSATPPPANP